MKVEDDGATFRVVSRPRRSMAVVYFFFSLFWNGFLTVFTLFASFVSRSDPTAYFMLAMSGLFWLVGIYLFYYGLSGIVKRTTTIVDAEGLRVTHRPLPWPGNRQIPAEQLTDIFVSRTSSHKGKSGGRQNTFGLHAVLGSGRKETLVDGYANEGEALRVSELLKQRLRFHERGDFARAAGDTVPVFPMPPGFEVFPSQETLRIEHRGSRIKYLTVLVFALFWDGAVVFFTMTAPWFAYFFLFPFWVAGLGLLYYCVAGLANKRTITVSSEAIQIEVGPLPWPGGRTIPTREVEQLYVREEKHKGKGGSHYSYAVLAVDGKTGRHVPLITGFDQSDEAHFVERTVEDFLRIENRPVEGEIRSGYEPG